MNKGYSIKELEALSGIKAHTIRIWEKRYNLLKPRRTTSNIRYYPDREMKHLLNISQLYKRGLKISTIAGMDRVEISDKVRDLSEINETKDERIVGMTLAMMNMDNLQFERIFSNSLLHYGFEKTISSLIFPLLKRTGILWQTGAITPAQEHFISNIIRQKIIVAIDNQMMPTEEKADKYMLFLPEGELHELSLLFSHYLILSRGKKVIYLGADVPLKDAKEVYDQFKPEFTLSVFTSHSMVETIKKTVEEMREFFKQSKILLSGCQILENKIQLPKDIKILHDLEEMSEHLEQ